MRAWVLTVLWAVWFVVAPVHAAEISGDAMSAALQASYRKGDYERSAELVVRLKLMTSLTAPQLTQLELMQTRLSVLGQPAPSMDGVTWYQGDGVLQKNAVIVFFETWCPHCKREVPAMPARVERHGVQLVLLTRLTRSSTDADVQDFVREHRLLAPVGRENGDVTRAMGIVGVPAAVFVRKGKVVWHGHPARLDHRLLAKLSKGTVKSLVGDVPEIMERARLLPMPTAVPVKGQNEQAEALRKARVAAREARYLDAVELLRPVLAGDDLGARRAAKRLFDELSVVGAQVPPAQADWMQGGADLAGPTLVVFWEVWCPHCKREVPKLQRIAERYQGQMEVVGFTQLSRSSTREGTERFLSEAEVTYPIGVVDKAYADLYAISGVPAAAIVRRGRIVWRGHPGVLDDAKIDRLLEADVDVLLQGVPEAVATLRSLVGPAANATPSVTDEAESLARRASKAVDRRDWQAAIALYEQLLRDHPSSGPARSAGRTLRQLKVVGTPEVSLQNVRWLHRGAPDGPGAKLIVFFETWCPHCRREVPKLNDNRALYEELGVQVVGLSKLTRGSTDDALSRFVDDHQLYFPVGVEDGAASQAYAVSGVPASVLLQGGRVIWRGHPAHMTEELLRALLGQ